MDLTLLTVPDCPHAAAFEERLAAALAGRPGAVVRRRLPLIGDLPPPDYHARAAGQRDRQPLFERSHVGAVRDRQHGQLHH